MPNPGASTDPHCMFILLISRTSHNTIRVQYNPQHPRHVGNLYRRYRCHDYDNAALFSGLFSWYSVDNHECITFEDYYQSVHGD
jgi:hypothetical protein